MTYSPISKRVRHSGPTSDCFLAPVPRAHPTNKGSNLEKAGVAHSEASTTHKSLPFGRLIFIPRKALILNGGQRRDRTADAGLFRAALYH